jgi:hypothetical protein
MSNFRKVLIKICQCPSIALPHCPSVYHWSLPFDSPTKRRKTGRRMTERRMTERRKTGRRMTERRMTERRKDPRPNRDPTSNDRTSNDPTPKGTERRIGLNTEFERRD